VLGIRIDGFKGMFKWEITPSKRFGTELSDYAKSAAGVGGLFHTDELPNYGITEDEVNEIKKELHLKENDAFVLIADNKKVAESALDAIKDRILNPLIKEVRKANDDATTTFLRPMPGAARMYPETDTIPIIPDVKYIKLPELIEEKIKRFEKEYKISADLATQIVKCGIEFEEIVKKYKKVSPVLIANTLINTPREIKRRYLKEIDVTAYIDELFTKLQDGKITNESVFEILCDIANGHKVDYSKYAQADEKEVEKEIIRIANENKGKTAGAVMGLVMAKYRGKIDGKKVSEILSKHLK
jgi:glutamyl-tRNA(Gln) amidotransferase subunit E